ncbi:MAG: hypothetical protein M3O91_05765 [Chloroflexota bacterium]|nr:hypothetical protein [Chloroflexota bacterium]
MRLSPILASLAGLAIVITAASPGLAAADPIDLHTPAAELRVSLGRLLAEHTFLVMEQMRASANAAPDLKDTAVVVEANTRDLQAMIGQVYGASAGQTFGDLWRAHIGYIVDYALASQKGDEAGKQRALAALAKYRDDLAAFLASANPNISAAAEAETLERHIDHLISYTTKDYTKAYDLQRLAYAHMFTVGDELADPLIKQFPATFTGEKVAFSPASSLRIGLGRSFGEHAVLTMEAMRSRLTGSAEGTAVATALDANRADLASWIAQIYGAPAGTAFDALWKAHVRAYLDYVDAVALKDQGAKQKAVDALLAGQHDLARFLAGANPNVTEAGVEGLLAEHLRGLTGQVDAYAAPDYPKTYALVRSAYAHMFMLGDALATAIAQQFPKEFPTGLPTTSTATAGAPLSAARAALISFGFLLVAAGVAILARRAGAGAPAR